MKLARKVLATMLAVATLVAGTAFAEPAAHSTLGSPASSTRVVSSASTTSTAAAAVETGRVIVRLKGSATRPELASLARSADSSAGATTSVSHETLGWRVPKGVSASRFAKRLEKSGLVEYAESDYVRQLTYTPPAYVSPNDPAFTSSGTGYAYTYTSSGKKTTVATYPYVRSWWLRDVNAPQAWAQGYDIVGKYPLRASGPEFTVAVLDSGLYTTHPDVGVTVLPGRDFFASPTFAEDNDVTPVDPSQFPRSMSADERLLEASHGTCVAGEIGATVDNGVGTVGDGYDTQVIVHKVMGVDQNGTVGIDDYAVIQAIYHSVDVDHAKVINMSLGGYEYSQALADAIDYAYSKGCVIVAAKGNDGSSKPFYPGSNAHVVSVGALDKNAKGSTIPADFTNYNKTALDIMAPGAFIFGLVKPGENPDPTLAGTDYAIWDGTSMAAPVVAGAIAWLWRAAPALSNTEITNIVLGSATKKAAMTHFPSGYRELNMSAAYATLKSEFPLLAPPALSDFTVASLGSVPVAWSEPTAPLRGVTYSWSADATQTGQTSATRLVFPWTSDDHSLTVTAHSVYNWDDGTASRSATVHVVAPSAGASAWTRPAASSTTPAYAKAVGFSATLTDASGTQLSGAETTATTLQSSANGASFAPMSGASVSNLSAGVYTAAAAPTTRTYYRFAFAGSGDISSSVSAAVVVTPHFSLSTPKSKSSVKHTAHFSVTGTLKPGKATSSRAVKLKIYRWNGHKWASYTSKWTHLKRRSSAYSTYSVTLKLSRKSRYRIYAYARGDGKHAATTSGYKSVTVK